MPLSEYEQRVLEQLERDLGSDPKLGQAMSRSPRSRSRLTWSVLGVVVGLAVVLAGAVAGHPIVGVAGFALMVFAALWGMLAPSPTRLAASKAAQQSRPKPSSSTKSDFMSRMEERFDRRREQGDL